MFRRLLARGRRGRERAVPDMLRFEFQQCAEDARAVVARWWQVVYIFLSAIILGLALVASQLVNLAPEEHDWSTLGLIALVGVVGMALACALIGVNRRHTWVLLVTYERMRQIEGILGMRKHMYIDILDHWTDRRESGYWVELPQDDQQFLSDIEQRHRRLRPPLPGAQIVALVASLTILGWLGLVLWEVGVVLEQGG